MAEDKGKGRAFDGDNTGKSDEPSQGLSFISQVVASANGLVRNTFTAPGSNELSGIAAAALADAGKGQPSTLASSSTGAERYTSQQAGQSSGYSAFKTTHSEAHVQLSENEFSSFLDEINSFTPSEQGLNISSASNLQSHSVQNLDRNISRKNISYSSPPAAVTTLPHSTSIAEQQSRDGDDVLVLLSEPTAPFEAPEPDIESLDWGLTPEQKVQLRSITQQLFPDTPLHSKSFTSSFVPTEEQSAEFNRQQWEVLTRYTDEVWGNLMPLVVQAREELVSGGVEEDGVLKEESVALRRLKGILGHLKQY